MDIFMVVVLNCILVMFPLFVYFIYNCYRELTCEQYNSLLHIELNFQFVLRSLTASYICHFRTLLLARQNV